jgi:hypothetical protein
MDRPVTELDFRMPEFRDAKPEDYEFRDDGKIVRKDRWQRGINKIASILDMNGRSGFEIDDVIARVQTLTDEALLWQGVFEADFDYHMRKEAPPSIDLKLGCGSVLRNVVRTPGNHHDDIGTFAWGHIEVPHSEIAEVRFQYSAEPTPAGG